MHLCNSNTNNNSKNYNWSILPSEKALTGFFGIKFSITEVIGGGEFILKSFQNKISIFSGFIMPATIKAKEIAIKVVNKYKKIDLPPITMRYPQGLLHH